MEKIYYVEHPTQLEKEKEKGMGYTYECWIS